MRNYKELSKIYEKKFLNYIISRSKKINYKWGMEYEDLVSDGILKLVELYHDDTHTPDRKAMASLVNFYNDIERDQSRDIHPMSIDELVYTIEETSSDFEEAYGIMKKSKEEVEDV